MARTTCLAREITLADFDLLTCTHALQLRRERMPRLKAVPRYCHARPANMRSNGLSTLALFGSAVLTFLGRTGWSRAASWFNRFWRCAYSSASSCHCRRPDVFLLVGHSRRPLRFGCGLALPAHRPRQHDGIHACAIEPVLDPSGRRPKPADRPRLCSFEPPSRKWMCRPVTEAERAAAASFTSVPRSLAATVSPGWLVCSLPRCRSSFAAC